MQLIWGQEHILAPHMENKRLIHSIDNYSEMLKNTYPAISVWISLWHWRPEISLKGPLSAGSLKSIDLPQIV